MVLLHRSSQTPCTVRKRRTLAKRSAPTRITRLQAGSSAHLVHSPWLCFTVCSLKSSHYYSTA